MSRTLVYYYLFFDYCSYFRNGKNIVQELTISKCCKIGNIGVGGSTRLEYDEAPHAITGAKVRQYGSPEYSDVSEAVTLRDIVKLNM